MGLFGKKKSKKVSPPAASTSYSPPEVTMSEVASPDDDLDIVKVPSVNSNGSDDSKKKSLLEEDPEAGVVGEPVFVKAKSYAKSLKEKSIVLTDDIMVRVTGCWAAVLAFWFSLSKVVQVALLGGAALGAVGVIALVAAGGRSPSMRAGINVAFVGNSYFYVNDLPRFVEKIAGGHVHQDSVIHNSASILQILMTGNGMWTKWATANAMKGGVRFETYRNTTEYLYDMGACSVPQLLTGHDQMVTIGNRLGSFINDGNNPCFQQDAYREYEESTDLKKSWDFVVLTDQSKAMAFDETRHDTLAAFNYTYGPLLKKERISPIIVQPHAFTSSGASSSGLSDLATFTALIMEGAQIYRKYINKRTGVWTKAHIAPVGNAFLAVYEESPDDIYPKLFLDDGIHPSAYGTFLYGCVIYATMTGYMPKYSRVVVDDMENSILFADARRLQASSSQAGFPTKDEAAVLYKIAKRVAVKGYKPKSLRGFKIDENAADFLKSSNDYAYGGNYNNGQQYAQNNNAYDQMYQNQNYQGNNNYDNYQNGNNGGNYGGNNAGDDANQQYEGGYEGNYGNNGNNNQAQQQYYYYQELADDDKEN
mmetsp:Transcript_27229/g.58271  ORF Transcript_27229/g.58271 Transcript_27229/m.58271 type:complete len:591 (-) Transcript_27229:201-1973(-)